MSSSLCELPGQRLDGHLTLSLTSFFLMLISPTASSLSQNYLPIHLHAQVRLWPLASSLRPHIQQSLEFVTWTPSLLAVTAIITYQLLTIVTHLEGAEGRVLASPLPAGGIPSSLHDNSLRTAPSGEPQSVTILGASLFQSSRSPQPRVFSISSCCGPQGLSILVLCPWNILLVRWY